MRSLEQVPALPSVYGRDAEQKILHDRLARQTAACMLIIGTGGIGKTRLLQVVRQMLTEQARPCPPIFDFFLVENFRSSQIEDMILQVVAPLAQSDVFKPYRAQRAAVEHARQSGEAFSRERQKLRDSFVRCYNDLAAELVGNQPPICLIFDSVEQAVQLTDRAEERLALLNSNAGDGGEAWLREILPQLQHTHVILSGRPQTLFGADVSLYAAIEHTLQAERINLTGLDLASVEAFLRAIRERFEKSANETIRERARNVALDADWVAIYDQIALGHPFWLSIIYTVAMLASLPSEVDALYAHRVGVGPSPAPISSDDLRASMIQALFNRFDESQDETVLALQWMAVARKGLSRAMLAAIASHERSTMDVDRTFDYLSHLLVVKVSHSASSEADQGVADDKARTAGDEVWLHLHDEMYYWLDRNERGVRVVQQSVSKALVDWYNAAIRAEEVHRMTAVDTLLTIGERHAAASGLRMDAAHALRRERRLILDRLGYLYALDHEHGRFEYNLQAYDAITDREHGYSVALRQEALRNIYLWAGRSQAEEVEWAAHWLLRAVWTEDKALALELLPQLERLYQFSDRAHTGIAYAQLRLAVARAYQDFAPNAQSINWLLIQAEADSAHEGDTQPDGGVWRDLLRAQIFNARGLLYRREYQLYDAIEQYRKALASIISQHSVYRNFNARTLNNLAYAYSEQGMVREARRYARQALVLNQRYSSPYFVALGYNTLARIEIRSGDPLRAQQYARRARAILRRINSSVGLQMCLPVLAEAYRKDAERLDDDPPAQQRAFALAVGIFRTALGRLRRERSQRHDIWRETRQGLGRTYRSLGHALRRRQPDDPEAQFYLRQAEKWLKRALRWAVLKHQPTLIKVDLAEDLTVVHVIADEFDPRIEDYIRNVEALTPQEYLIKVGQGLPPVARPVHGFWRELGQCELQRMLTGFGAYDYGYYAYDPVVGRSPAPQRIGDLNDLRLAARHMVLTFAYLTRFDLESAVTSRAIYLALRELRFHRTADQLKAMLQAAYQAASDYNLIESEALRLTERLMEQAVQDLELIISKPLVE